MTIAGIVTSLACDDYIEVAIVLQSEVIVGILDHRDFCWAHACIVASEVCSSRRTNRAEQLSPASNLGASSRAAKPCSSRLCLAAIQASPGLSL